MATRGSRVSETIQGGQLGLAGEYFVAGQLILRGRPAAFTKGNSQDADILARKGPRNIAVQVKAVRSNDPPLKPNRLHDDLTYIVVDVVNPDTQRYYVIPGHMLRQFHYSAPNGIDGRIPLKKCRDFENRWDVLEA